MVPFNLKLLAKFGFFSDCSNKLHAGCSLARARKIFASVRMLRFSLLINLALWLLFIHINDQSVMIIIGLKQKL